MLLLSPETEADDGLTACCSLDEEETTDVEVIQG